MKQSKTNSLTFFLLGWRPRLGATTPLAVFGISNSTTSKEHNNTMPLFNSDDYNNLHPELEQTPAGMTDNSYTIAMYREYVSWLTTLVESWPESRSEIDKAFASSPL